MMPLSPVFEALQSRLQPCSPLKAEREDMTPYPLLYEDNRGDTARTRAVRKAVLSSLVLIIFFSF